MTTTPAELRELRPLINQRLGRVLHGDDEESTAAFRELNGMIDGEFMYVAIAGLLAIATGESIRAASAAAGRLAEGRLFGVDPQAAAHGPRVVAMNRAIAAAANHDIPTMHAVLGSITDAHDMGAVLGSLARYARELHATVCTDRHCLRPGL